MIEQPTAPIPSSGPTVRDEPVPENKRIECLDFIRGIAILCILPINVFGFSMPMSAYAWPYAWGDASKLDLAVFSAVYLIVFAKFYSIFSILFGAGLWLQTDNSAQKGHKPERLYLRRLLFLAAVGLVHGLLFWWGDILLPYAITGLIVLYLRNISMNALRWTAVLLLSVPTLCCFMAGGGLAGVAAVADSDNWPAEIVGQHPPSRFEDAPDAANKSFAENLKDMAGRTPDGRPMFPAIVAHIYANGNWFEVAVVRAIEWTTMACSVVFSLVLVIMGYNLLGVWMMRRGVFADVHAHAAFWKKMIFWGFLVGVPIHLFGIWNIYNEPSALGMITNQLTTHLGALGMTLAYLGVLVLFSQTSIAKRLGGPLRACGRMAFTCYLAQTLVMTTIFYGYGFGLYGRYGHATLQLFTLGMWTVLLIFCPLWLKRYKMGPLEWLWRSFTYGELQGNKRIN